MVGEMQETGKDLTMEGSYSRDPMWVTEGPPHSSLPVSPVSLVSPALAGRLFTWETLGRSSNYYIP